MSLRAVDLLAGDLLGAEVIDRAEDLPGRGERRGLGEASDAEVGDHRATGDRSSEDVLGLDVAVDDAVLCA